MPVFLSPVELSTPGWSRSPELRQQEILLQIPSGARLKKCKYNTRIQCKPPVMLVNLPFGKQAPAMAYVMF
jgi:hypothetical protein